MTETVTLTVRVPARMHRWLELTSDRMGRSLESMALDALSDYLSRFGDAVDKEEASR